MSLLPRGAFSDAGEERGLQAHLTSMSDAGEEQRHLTSLVTPDLHWCVRVDLVTGPPEIADDDEIQSLGIGLRCCWIAWSVQSSSLQFSLFGHTLAALLVDSCSPSRSRQAARA